MKTKLSYAWIAALAAWPSLLVAEATSSAMPAQPQAAEPPAETVVAPGAKVEKLAGDFIFTEGTTCDAKGNVFFVDQNNDRIMEWSVDGKLSTFKQPSGYANGMYFDGKGNLIACADEKNELWSIAPDGNVTVLVKDYQGKLLDGPNDVWVRPDGGMYITDPFYRRAWWDPATHAREPEDVRAVYFLSSDHKTLTRVVSDFNTPNGIIGTPDGKTLFVSDINGGKTWGYDIQADGTLTAKRLVCNVGSDGMTIDEKGNLYMSARGTKGVTVVDSKTGKQIEFIPVPEAPANMCFGGKDHQTLYIAARTGFYAVKLKYKGANAAK